MVRFMRVIVFFDLPMKTSENRRNYSRFLKYLKRSGFVMMQQSVYSKICLNGTGVQTVKDNLRKNKPKSGFVQYLCITEQQYSKIENLTGEYHTEYIVSDERTVIL